MATTIVTKNSSTAAAVPTAAQLVQGELAVNVADKRLYTEDSVGGIVELGTNPSAEIVANGGIALPDNGKATFGASDDLQIYHDGSNSRIVDAGTGNLSLQGNDLRIKNSDASATYIQAANGGAVELAYNNHIKLATTATGIDVTGTATMDGLVVDKASGGGEIARFNGGSYTALDFAGGLSITSDTTTNFNRYWNFNAGDALDIYRKETSSGTTDTRAITCSGGGDISFYEDTGTTPKLFWDASAESLGIGTSSPVSELSVLKNQQADTAVEVSNIGIAGATTTASFIVSETAGVPKGWLRRYRDGTAKTELGYSGTLAFTSGIDGTPAERMRIDSAGNLLVGKSGVDTATAGIELRASNLLNVTRDNSQVLQLNRLSSDGEIAKFLQDGTAVGSIGASSPALFIGSGDVGIRFDGANDRIRPVGNASNLAAVRNGAIDLGDSGAAFKDLYLSGGVYLGGTGAANKLDDYEEGTWTPTAATIGIAGNLGSRYTKIGNLVTLTCQVVFGSSASTDVILIGGIPFAASATQAQSSSGVMHNLVTLTGGRTSLHTYITNNNTAIGFYESGSGLTYQGVTINNMSDSSIVLNIQYMTDS